MMKKKADPMFRKAQLKLFSVITSILLAVFIALLAAVNIITKEVMNRQSEYVLEQIAAGIEYDDISKRFTLSRPDDYQPKNNYYDIWSQIPVWTVPVTTTNITTSLTTSSVTDVTTSDVTTSTTTEETTEEPTQEEERTEESSHDEEQHEEEHHDEPQQTQPPQENTESTVTMPELDPNFYNWTPEDWEKWNNYQREYWEQFAKDHPEMEEQWKNWNQGGQQGGQQWGNWGYGQQGGQQPQWGWGQVPGGQQNIPNNGYQWGGQPWGGQPESKSSESKDKQKTEDEKPKDESKNKGMAYTDAYEGGIVALSDSAETIKKNPPDAKREPPPPEKQDTIPDIRVNEPVEPIPKTLGSIDFFAVMADKDGKFMATLNNDDLSNEMAQKYISKIIESNITKGMLNNFQFYCRSKQNGTLMVFTDKSSEIDVLSNLKHITIIVGLVSIIVLSVAAFFLSKKSIEPIRTAFERQKQFVSDASHELKTPLTVISTNADVLEGEIGDNRWLGYIKSQTERMSILVNDLLKLTRLENNTAEFIRTDFDMSKAIENTALPFECQAFEQNKNFIIDVDKGITVNGSEQHIKQMAAIFIDNALKYSNDGGMVKVMLKKQGEKKIFSVYNTGQGIKEADKERIFERFYRSDASRDRATGGYGLGLAIAKSIIDKHKFKVNILNQEGKSVCFVVIM